MNETTPVTISSSVASEGPIDEAKLRETLDYIRPAVQADGGDLVLLGVEDGAVNIQMVGACGGCPLDDDPQGRHRAHPQGPRSWR